MMGDDFSHTRARQPLWTAEAIRANATGQAGLYGPVKPRALTSQGSLAPATDSHSTHGDVIAEEKRIVDSAHGLLRIV